MSVTVLAVLAVGVVAGAVAWYFRPEAATLVSIGIGTVFGVGMVAFLESKWQADADRVRFMTEQGIAGQAEVLSIAPTNVTVNRRPQAQMRLRVFVDGRAPYELERVDLLPLAGVGAAPGRRVRVYVNPDDSQDLMIDWSSAVGAPPAAAATDAGQRLRQLDDLHRQGLVSDDEYRRKREQILSDL